jgi:hypothetical protein
MAEKTCSHCVHVDVCENRFSWLDQEDNTKHIICRHFKDKADVVDVVRCRDCKHLVINPFGNGDICCRWDEWVYPKPNDFCSYGEPKPENE